jgi:tRNA dimethylallyltransferase
MVATGKIELVAIVGPTASGKSGLAMETARRFNGEIIAADSRTIYKGMDIGTAKPSKADQAEIPHWGLDLVEPGQGFSAQKFKVYANQKITDINLRGKLAILVGGTGLYMDSVLYDFQFGPAADAEQRSALERLNVEQLQIIIEQKGLARPENIKNKRHLIRTIERRGQAGTKRALRPGRLIIGLAPPDQELKKNIEKRAGAMLKAGLLDETRSLIDMYGREAVLKSGGHYYKICVRLLNGQIDEQTATTSFARLDWQYARRQRTWFRRNHDAQWFKDREKAFLHLNKLLST